MDPLAAALAEVEALCAAGRIRAALERVEATLSSTDVREGPALDGLRRVRMRVSLSTADRPRADAATLRDLEDARGVGGATLARARVLRGHVMNRLGDATASRAILDEALAVARRCADPGAEVEALCELAELAIESGDVTGARAALASAKAIARPEDRERLLAARGHIGLRAGHLVAVAGAYQELQRTARWAVDRADACYELAAIAQAEALALADRGSRCWTRWTPRSTSRTASGTRRARSSGRRAIWPARSSPATTSLASAPGRSDARPHRARARARRRRAGRPRGARQRVRRPRGPAPAGDVEELWRERVRTVGRAPTDEALLDAGLAERQDDRIRWVDPLVERAVAEARARTAEAPGSLRSGPVGARCNVRDPARMR